MWFYTAVVRVHTENPLIEGVSLVLLMKRQMHPSFGRFICLFMLYGINVSSPIVCIQASYGYGFGLSKKGVPFVHRSLKRPFYISESALWLGGLPVIFLNTLEKYLLSEKPS